MKLRHLILAMVLLAVVAAWTVQAQSSDPDEAAFVAAQSRWPLQGFALKIRLPGTDYWTYEVGRIEIFGRRLVLGRGGSWTAAFAMADESAQAGTAPPLQ